MFKLKQTLFFSPLSTTSQFNPSNFNSLFDSIEQITGESIPEQTKMTIKRLSLNRQKEFRDLGEGSKILESMNHEVGLTIECYDYSSCDNFLTINLLRSPSGHLIANISEILENDHQGLHSWYIKQR